MLSKTEWNGLQAAQNANLRAATGCVKMTGIDHLHTEAKMMKVKPHCSMLSKHYLLATQKQDHPCKINLLSPPPRRPNSRYLKDKTEGDPYK